MKTPPPRKRFGQNFLKDKEVINRIVDSFNPKDTENVIEIGPGQGALTQALLSRLTSLDVVEIDRDLAAMLEQNYGNKLRIHLMDVLKCDFHQFTQSSHSLRFIGNLPYNISTPILFHLFSFSPLIHDMQFMLQKEVVMRMAANTQCKEYGRLSVMTQYYCQVKSLFDVPPNAFSPAPKVMSTVVHLTPHPDTHPRANDETLFAQVVNLAFQQRRKTIRNSLKAVANDDTLAAANIDPTRRPETLNLEEFISLSNQISQQNGS